MARQNAEDVDVDYLIGEVDNAMVSTSPPLPIPRDCNAPECNRLRDALRAYVRLGQRTAEEG